MTPRNLLLALVSAGVLASWGCGQDQRSGVLPADDRAGQSSASAERPETAGLHEQTIRGELKDIDLDAQTFVLVDHDGAERVFAFSDATEIRGDAPAQGLAGREGAHVTVHFRDEGPVRLALAIEIE